MSSTTTPVRVTTFPLKQRHLIATGICATVMLLSSNRAFVEPGSPLYDYALKSFNPDTVHTVQNWVFRFLFYAHGAEVPLFAWFKLRKHGVSVFSGLGLKWLTAIFLSGKATWDLWAHAVALETAKRV